MAKVSLSDVGLKKIGFIGEFGLWELGWDIGFVYLGLEIWEGNWIGFWEGKLIWNFIEIVKYWRENEFNWIDGKIPLCLGEERLMVLYTRDFPLEEIGER